MARRNRPHDPAKATEAALARKEREAEKLRLEAQGATVKTDAAGRIVSAYRSNVFNLLLQRGTITANHHDAAHRLCQAWAQWKGLDGKPEAFGEVVDGSAGAAELVTDRMIRGGREVEYTLSQLAPQARKLLESFVFATVEEDRPMQWRGIVERTTGETDRARQTGHVTDALEALRVVYQEPGRVAA